MAATSGWPTLKKTISKTLSNIPSVPFSATVGKLEAAFGKVLELIEKFKLQKEDFEWIETLQKQVDRGIATKTEMAIVSQMITLAKDKASLAYRMKQEKNKA